ncbi:DUF3572 family protein [Aurantiacibacter xanthus]|uniref:DUF3572 family protein n=1 Tax=Aurantiacibacter xanthus TaxID=1784712 RepID=A0A3A1PDS4_9SPHN|nr:DUF3572 family protein [Aurantiacibacter xanthus]
MASLPSATGSTEKPPARNTSQNSLRLRSLSSTTRIRFDIAGPSAARRFARLDCLSLYRACGKVTIPKDSPVPPTDRDTLALAALGWILSDGERAERFLALTGLTPDGLRSAIGDSATHQAVFDFLAAHEPDLVAAADALGVAPQALVPHRSVPE